jgi:erythromycin esterase-like protein
MEVITEMIRPLLLACTLVSACASAPARDRDIAAITDLACRNDVVLLGELPSHGEATAFELKARIVQELVQRCGVDAVLFEAPIYDFFGFNEAIRQNRADTTQLSNAIGRFWLTRELVPFRMWLFDRARAGRLVVGGVDDQVSVTSLYARSRQRLAGERRHLRRDDRPETLAELVEVGVDLTGPLGRQGHQRELGVDPVGQVLQQRVHQRRTAFHGVPLFTNCGGLRG